MNNISTINSLTDQKSVSHPWKRGMSKVIMIFGVILSIGISSFQATAQQFPVQVNTTLTPPYSIYLADYTAPESNSLQVMLSLRDLDRNQYQVKLRITLEGQGVTLRTSPGYVPPPIILQGGIPETLTGFDLRNYFNPNNLEFSGLSKSEFIQMGALPEGFYTLTIEAFDYNRSVPVSNLGMANAWMVLNDPPIINIPFFGEKVRATDPQNVMFNWTPRHTASPNAAFNTEYEFSLVEIYPAGRNPNDAILTSNTIYTTTTTATSLNYGITEPLLIPGRQYAFRIKAYDVNGRDLFKNQGFTEVSMFQFGDECVPPDNITGESLDPNRIKLEWDPREIHTEFDIQYRQQGTSDWYEETTLSNALVVPGLTGGTTYEYQLKARCGTIAGEYTTVATITTDETEEDAFMCGADVETPELSTEPLNLPLVPLMPIKTADFDIVLKEVEANGDGTYKGTGIALMPWFKLATVRVKFSNIRVNKDFRVYEGNITTVYSPNSNFVMDLDLDDELKDEENTDDSTDPADPESDFFDNYDFVDTVTVDGVITDVVEDENGDVIITYEDENGDTQTETIDSEDIAAGDVLISDSNGNDWAVDQNGDITENPVNPPDPIDDPSQIDYIVAFKENANQTYGFDSKTYNAGQYDQAVIKEQEYWVAWKSVETGRQDFVNATTDREQFPEEVGFKTVSGEMASIAASNPKEKQLTVIGKVAGDKETIDAYVKVTNGEDTEDLVVGKVNVQTYNKLNNKLIIVPVNDASAPNAATLSDELNKIYAQAVAGWDVEVLSTPYTEDDPDKINGLNDGESGLFASFPSKMRQFNRAFKNSISNFDRDAYYLFLVEGSGSQNSGFMPFKRQFGYIFTDNLGGTPVEKVIAHELGHGAFRLRHTFSPEAFLAAEGDTDNLMDYANGTRLKKFQWDNVHDPESVNGWFADDEESGYALVNNLEELSEYANADGTYTFMSPAGLPITLPSDVKYVVFATGEGWNGDSFSIVPLGSLIQFSRNDSTYKAVKGAESGYFNGYKYKDGVNEKVFVDSYSAQANPTHAILGYPCFRDQKVEYVVHQTEIFGLDYEAGYTATGPMQNFMSTTNQYFDLVGTPSLTVNAEMNLTEEAMAYLNWRSDLAACGQLMAPYIFINAFQISYNPNSYLYCDAQEDAYRNSPEFILLDGIPVDRGYVEVPLDDRPEVLKYYEEALQWIAGSSVYRSRNNALEKVSDLSSVTDRDEMVELLNEFEIFSCIWEGIAFDDRLHALNKLLDGYVPGDWPWSDDKENLVLKMLRTTPVGEDRINLLAEFKKNNNALLNKAYSKLDFGNNEELIAILTNWVLETNTYALSQVESLEQGTYYTNPGESVPLPDRLFVWEYTDGNIMYGNMTGKKIGRYDNGNYYWRSYHDNVTETIDPFELVKIEFRTNFPGGISENTSMVVPAIWAYRFNRQLNNQRFLNTVRILIDVAVIVGTVGTGSPIVAAIEIAFASADIIIAATQDDVIREFGSDGEDFLASWDQIMLVGGAAIGVQQLTVAAGKLSLKFSTAELVSKVKNLGLPDKQKLITNFTKMANSIKSIGRYRNLANWERAYYHLLDYARTIELQAVQKSAITTANRLSLQVKDYTRVVAFNALFNFQIARFETIAQKTVLTGCKWLPDGVQSQATILDEIGPISYEGRFLNTIDDADLLIVKVGDEIFLAEKTFLDPLQTGLALRNYLNAMSRTPDPVSYQGPLVRSISRNSEINYSTQPHVITDQNVYSSWGRYDIDGAENALYLGKTETGNVTELTPHYGSWEEFNTYTYDNVSLTGLLDLTDENVRASLRTELSQLISTEGAKAEMYEFTNEIASWARSRGYNGIIAPGARGKSGGLPTYENIVLFSQNSADLLLSARRTLNSAFEKSLRLKGYNSLADKVGALSDDLFKTFDSDFFGASDEILNAFNANVKLVDAWEIALPHATTRTTLAELQKIAAIIDQTASPNLAAGGFTKDMMKQFVQKLSNNPSLYSIISLEDIFKAIKSLEDLDMSITSIPTVRSGLQTSNIPQLRGELFRLSRLNHYKEVQAVEQFFSATGAYAGGRYIDISRNAIPRYIEVKYWASILSSNDNVISYAKQLHKDLLDIFGRISNGTSPDEAFALYLHEFRKSSGITSEAVLKQQVKDMFSKAPYKDLVIGDIGKSLSQVRQEIDATLNGLTQSGNGIFNDLDDLIDNSELFKVVE